jgi:hypothetical protein
VVVVLKGEIAAAVSVTVMVAIPVPVKMIGTVIVAALAGHVETTGRG